MLKGALYVDLKVHSVRLYKRLRERRCRQRLKYFKMFEVNILGWRCFLGALALLGSLALLSLMFLLVRMHEKLNLINGLYTLLFSISAVGVPLEVTSFKHKFIVGGFAS